MKAPLESRTIKAQIILAIIGVSLASIQSLDNIIPPEYMPLVILILTLGNTGISTYLRLVTSEPIGKEK